MNCVLEQNQKIDIKYGMDDITVLFAKKKNTLFNFDTD